jgi:hypothetical protein
MRTIAVEVPETDPAAETWLQLPGVADTEQRQGHKAGRPLGKT